jgi:hypothetical protein
MERIKKKFLIKGGGSLFSAIELFGHKFIIFLLIEKLLFLKIALVNW